MAVFLSVMSAAIGAYCHIFFKCKNIELILKIVDTLKNLVEKKQQPKMKCEYYFWVTQLTKSLKQVFFLYMMQFLDRKIIYSEI